MIDLIKRKAFEERMREAAQRIKTCFVPVPLSDVEKLPDPDYGFDVMIDPHPEDERKVITPCREGEGGVGRSVTVPRPWPV